MLDNSAGPGIDLAKYHEDVRKLVRSKCRFPSLDFDDLLQEIYLKILKANETRPWDPARGSMSHYIVMAAGSVALNMLAARRYRPEASEDEAPEVADERDPISAYEVARELGLDAAQFEAWLEEQDEDVDRAREARRAAAQALHDSSRAAAAPRGAHAAAPRRARKHQASNAA